MADTIWKFPLNIVREQMVPMPAGAEILSVHCQHEVPTIWAKVNPEPPPAFRDVRILGTGSAMTKEEGDFVGTCLMAGGALVWHVFISPEDKE